MILLMRKYYIKIIYVFFPILACFFSLFLIIIVIAIYE